MVGFTNRQAPFWAHQQNPVSVTNDKNHDKPLEEYVGGRAPGISLPLWSYKSRLLTPQTESRHHLLAEGCHPLQGDKTNKPLLGKTHNLYSVIVVKERFIIMFIAL